MPETWRRAVGAVVGVASIASSGCATAGVEGAGHTSSPWEWGGGLRISPTEMALGQGDVTLHPTVRFTYLSFDGGWDGLYEIGAQVRKPVQPSGLWIGGEAMLSHLRTSIDGFSEFNSSTNGFSISVLGGVPIGQGGWNPNAFGSVGISDYGAQGWNVRVGIEVTPR
jgi:hypothetical protein